MNNNIDDVMASVPTYTGPSVSSQIPNWVQPGTPNLHSGGFFGALDNVMSVAIPLFVAAGAAYMGGSAMGLFGGMGSGVAGTAGAGAGAGAGAVGAGLGDLSFAGLGGALPIDAAALGTGGAGFAGLGGLGGAATGLGAAAGAGGLGSMVGVAGGAPAVVTVGAPAAATGGGLGLGGTAGGLGLGGTALSGTLSGTNMDYGSPAALAESSANADAAASTPGSTDWLKLLQQGQQGANGLGSLLNAAGSLTGANRDRITSQQNQEYWDGMMNKMMGMYQPGTPEATLMEQQMNAKDSAAGRNSQYGVRATNLAGQLAQQRANIMTSPTFYQMGAASRGQYTNSLNSLFNVAGQGSAASSGGNLGNTIGQIGNGISSILGLGKSLFG